MGRLRGGDKWITLLAYEPTHTVGAKVMSCSLLYEHIEWKPHEKTITIFGHENPSMVCAFCLNQQGHTIKEYVHLKARICRQIDIGNIPHMWGDNSVLTYDQMDSIEHTRFLFHYLTPLRKLMSQIYSDLVRNEVLASICDDERGLDLVGEEIWRPCAYHNAISHSLSRCLIFLYDVEILVNLGKTESSLFLVDDSTTRRRTTGNGATI